MKIFNFFNQNMLSPKYTRTKNVTNRTMSLASGLLFFTSMSASTLLLSACNSSSDPDSVDNQMQKELDSQRLQEELALQSHLNEVSKAITKVDNPKVYEQWGSDWIDIINSMLPLAVDRVNDHQQCDKVIKAELAESSTIGKNPILNISCQNSENYFVGLNDIAHQVEPTPASELFGRSSDEYIQLCKKMVQSELQFPKTLKNDSKKTKVSSNKMIRQIEVYLPFKVKTAYDTEISHIVSCTIDSKTQNPKVIQVFWQ